MNILYANSIFDFSEYDSNPIQYFIEEPISFNIESERDKGANLYLAHAHTE